MRCASLVLFAPVVTTFCFSCQTPVPSILRLGSSKTVLSNFSQIIAAFNKRRDHECTETCNCVALNEHLKQFFSANLSTECILTPFDGCSQRLIMRGKFWPKDIECLLNNYAREYLESPCLSGSFDTRLERYVEKY